MRYEFFSAVVLRLQEDIITDERDDEPLNRPHIENGRRFVVPNSKIKWDSGHPTGHGIIFIGVGLEVYCYLPAGGG